MKTVLSGRTSTFKTLACLVLMILLTNFRVARAEEFSWPAFPTPDGASVSWAAQNMRYNNVPMQIRMMTSPSSPGQILEFYRNRWKDQAGKIGEMNMSPWMVLARTNGPFHFTVETRAVKGGSESVLTITRLPEMIEKAKQAMHGVGADIEKLGHGFPMMSGSKVQMDMESFDEGKQGRMIMHRNSFPVEDNALYLREQLILYGWVRNKENKSPDGRSRTLVFSRAHQELIITLSLNGSQTEIFSSQTDVN